MEQNYFDYKVLLDEKENPKYKCFSCHNIQFEKTSGWMSVTFIMDNGKVKKELSESFCSFRCFLIWLEENRELGTCKDFEVHIF
jgi:hypothetical protein